MLALIADPYLSGLAAILRLWRATVELSRANCDALRRISGESLDPYQDVARTAPLDVSVYPDLGDLPVRLRAARKHP